MTIWELIALAKSGNGGASSVFHFKGSVLNESALPDSGEDGDVYLVDSEDSYFAWDGEGWTDIGQLLTADEAQEIIADLSDEVDNLKNALTSGAQADAIYHLGFYLDNNGDLCQKED
jgi:hypothetical protein